MHDEQGLPGGALQSFTTIEVVGALFLAAGAAVIFPVQPVLLDALLHDGRLTAVQVGQAATAELIGMAGFSFIASAFFPVQRSKFFVLSAVAASCLANLLTLVSTGSGVIAARLLSGCCSGVVLWLFVSMLVRSGSPARLNGIYVASLSLLGLCLATLCTQWSIPHFGARGAVGCLLCLDVLMIAAAFLMPRNLVALPRKQHQNGAPEGLALFALLAIGAFFAALTSFWVYVIPISNQLGLRTSTINLAIDVAIVCQILGGLAAATIGQRIGYLAVMGSCTLVGLLVVSSLHLGLGATGYVVALGIFGIAWMFAPPYHVLFAIAAGPSRRAAMFLVTAQVVGAGVGPFVSSLAVGAGKLSGALWVSSGLFTFSLVLLLLVQMQIMSRRETRTFDVGSAGR